MDGQQFEFLYLNAHCLAAQALGQLAQEILGAAQADEPAPSAEDHAAAIADRLAALDLGAMDFAALDGLNLDLAADGVDLAAAAQDAAALPAPSDLPALSMADDATDLVAYLDRAYASAPRVRERVRHAQRRLDPAGMEARLAALPTDRPALTGRLGAEAFGQWLALYRAGHDGLSALVGEISRLDASG